MATQTRSQTDGRVTFEIPVPTFVSERLETGRARLKDLEGQAQDLIRDLYARGNRELDDLKGRLPIETLRERIPIEDLAGRARGLETQTRSRAGEVAADLERRLQELQDKTLGLIGVASREQVQSLAGDIDRLARRVDALARSARASKGRKAPAKAPAKTAKARSRTPKGASKTRTPAKKKPARRTAKA